jgi:hypothetical protein
MGVNRLKLGSIDLWGRAILGWLRSCRLSYGWLLGGFQGRFLMYGSVGGGLLGLWALQSLCWTRGVVRFVGNCLSWIDEVSWTHGILCASTSPRGLMWVPQDPHDVPYAYLSHPSSDLCKWYIRFDCLDEPIVMVQFNLTFEVVYDDILYTPLDQLLSTAPFNTYFGVPCDKT